MTSYIYPKKNSFKGVVSLVTYITMVMLLLSSVYNANACGPLNGIIPIGASQPNNTSGWTSIANALTYINANGLDGHTILELQTDYSAAGEPLPITFPVNACINISQTLTIRPASLVASPFVWSNGTTNSAVVLMDGASYVTIDGRPGGAGTNKYIRIVNTSTTSASSGNAVLLKNDANNNILTYLDVQSANGNAAVSSAVVTAGAIPGAIVIGTTSGTNGNDNNTISFCDVHSTGANLGTCIYAGNNTTAGTAGNNDNNTITNNNIYDFYLSASPSAGINISLGNNSWTITNNHVYQTGTRNYGASTPAVRGFLIVPNNGSLTSASGFIITGNYIGGNAANGSGLYTTTGTANYTFRGMDVSVGLGTATSIQNNTLTNWSISGGFNGNSVYGIDINAGNADVGTITGNVVGSTSTTGAITVTTSVTNGSMIGLRSGSAIGGIINFSNDTISGINMVGTATTVATGFNGIAASGGATITVSNNVVGSATLTNSINMVSTSSTSTSAVAVRGIICNSGVTGVVNSITNNLVANINSNYSAGVTGNTLVGIDVRTGTSTISDNVIRNLTTNSLAIGSGSTPAAIGISYISPGTSTLISNNTIHSLKLTHPTTTAATQVTGIYFNGPSSGTHTIERNFIHSISMTSPTNSAGFITGIDLGTTAGVTITFKNNMIRLGYNETGASIVSPCTIRGITKTLPNTNIWFNSIYIGGTGVGTTATNTFCLTRPTAATDDWRNNVLVNNRSNATTGGKHYRINLINTATLTLNYNVYYGAGTGTVFGFNGSDVASYSSGWVTGDVNSWTFDPNFIDPTGNSTSVDLHISTSLATPVEGLGTNIASVTNDYDDLTPRSGLTPVDIGADAGNFQALSACATPGTPGIPSLTAVLPSQINGTFTAGSGADSYLIVRYNGGDPETPPVSGTTYTAGQPLGSGTVVAVTSSLSFSATGLFGGTTYDFYVYSLNNICIGTSLYSAASTSSATTLACTGLAGIVPIGPGQPNTSAGFTSITNALTFLNANGLTASTILEIQSGYLSSVEPLFPLVIGNIPCSAPTKTLTIRPASGATGLSITSSAAAIIDFEGANYVTIDGRPAGTVGAISVPNSNYLTITNTLATGVVVQMINDASNNAIKYCDLQGQNTTTAALPGSAAGVVFIGNTTGTTGNDNNIIDNCNIHSTLNTNTLTMGVYSFGPAASGTVTPAFNDNNSITNNNIYDIYGGVNLPTAGIELEKGTNAWTITGNSFFQTVNRAPILTASVTNRGIYIIPTNTAGVGNGFTITGNYFGGMAPQCGGNNYQNISTGAFNNLFDAIFLGVSGGTTSNIKSNTINNFNLGQAANGSDLFHAIWVPNVGNVNIGGPLSGDGNIVGTSTAIAGTTTGITLNSGSACSSHMIIVPASGIVTTNVLVQNNKIGGITLNGNGMTFSALFCNSSATVTFDNNLVGSTTIANSINATYTGTTTLAMVMRGINIASGSPTCTITNNTIANLTSATTTPISGSQTGGIVVSAATSTIPAITGNTIFNISCAAAGAGGSASSTVIGIASVSTTAVACNISNNTIYNLISTSASTTATILMEGIFYLGNTTVTNTVSGNNVHSFNLNAINPTLSMRGIECNGGTMNVFNNMVRLGINAAGSGITAPISIYGMLKSSSAVQNFYHNSVYIGGSGVTAGTQPSYAYWRLNASTLSEDLKNNIFVNARSGAGTGKHYAVFIAAGQTANLSINNNVYQATGTNGFFAFNGTADVASYAANWFTGDANSWAFDPKFINPTGSATGTPSPVVDLHIMPPPSVTPVEGMGVNIPSVTLDFDGDTRSAFSAVDIGADAGNFTALSACATPGIPGIPSLISSSPTQINGTFTAGSGADNYLIVRYNSGDPETPPVNGTTYTAGQLMPGGLGTVVAVTSSLSFSATGLFGGTTYDFYVYSLNNICIGTSQYSAYSTNSQTTASCIGLTGIVPVGPGQPNDPSGFTSLTNAMTYLNTNGLTASTFLELQSTYNSSVEGFPIVIGSIPCSGPGKILTIRPAGAAVTITSANTTATIDINGATYVNIDGRPGGTGTNKYLLIENTSTTAASAGNAILVRNESSNNLITYCEVRSPNSNAAANTSVFTIPGNVPGAIAIGTTTGTNGNDNNTISYCDVHSLSSGGDLGAGIFAYNATSAGTAANNDNNTIDSCNIYDFYLAGTASAGINISLGNNNWTITNNRVFQTGSRDYGVGIQTVRGFWITPNNASLTSASGFVISGNYIGGTASNGTGVYTMTGTGTWTFNGIDLSLGLGTASSVQNNTVTNINETSGNAASSSFIAINVANGNVNIGTTTGNLIGSATANGAITFTGTANVGGVRGISISAGGTLNISNNTISGIDLISNTASVTTQFNGIVGAGTNCNISNNTIGSPTLANSINGVSASTGAGTSIHAMRGINVNGGTTSAVTGNLIANMNTNYAATGTQATTMIGIIVSASTSTVTGDTVRNLTSATQTTGSGASSAIVGIAQTTTSAGITVSRNTIHSLRLTNPGLTAGAQITGIFINGPTTGTNVVSRNNIHSLSLASSTNTASTFTGITVSTGTTNYTNNMIRLGYDESGNEITAGVQLRGISKGAPNTNNFYHNSIFIGGTNVISSALNSFAFQRSFAPSATPNDDIRDNIFVNNRSNASTGGKHYVFSAVVNTFLTLNNNVYYFNGTGGVFALNITTPVPSYITNWLPGDASSYPVDPLYINPTGSAVTGDLHIGLIDPTIVESSGILIAAVSDDFDGETRAFLTATDIGADAGDFANLVCNGAPPSSTAIYSGSTDNICVSGTKTLTLSNFPSTPGLILQWQESATPGGPYTNVTGGSGATTITFTTPTITQTMYYICLVTCVNGGLSTPSSEKAVVVDDPQVLTTTPGTTCGPGTVTLSAIASAGASISWFTALTGGSALSSFPYLNIPVTGFNNDVVANGVGDGTNGTTLNTVSTGNMNGMVTQPGVGMDGAGNTFIDGTYQWYTGSTLPACFLPASGQIPSALTSGLTYQLNSYSGLNAMTIESNTYGGSVWPTAGTVTLATPASYSTLKVLYETVSNSAGPTITATLTFTDATTQVITGNTFVNWMTATGVAYAPHISRAQNVAPGNPFSCAAGPYLFEMTLPVSAANYNKLIQSITFNFSSTGGSTATTVDYLHVLAVGGVIPPYMNSYTTPVIFAPTPYYVQASIGSCISTPRTLVNANYTTPPALTLTANQNVCLNMVATISVTSNLSNFSSYTWAPITNLYSDAAATIPLTALDNLTTVYFKSSTVGSNSVTATATGGGCNNIVTTSVSTIAGPAVTITTTPNAVCPGGNIQLNAVAAGTNTYSWAANPTLSATNISNPVAQNIQSTQTYSVTVTAVSGCSTTQTINAAVNPVPDPSTSYNDGPQCEGSSLTLYGVNTGAGQTSTNWLWSGPSFSSTSEDYTFNPATLANSGTYTLTITNNFGCTASSTTNVIINPNPVVSVVSGSQINVSCNGLSDGSVHLSGANGTPPYFFDLDGTGSGTGIYTGLAAGTYPATIVNDFNNCSSAPLLVTITEPDVLTVSAGSNTPVCTGTSLNLSATPGGGTSGYSYVWTGPNGAIPSVQNPTIASATALDAGNYHVQVTDANSCTATSANHLVQVNVSPTAAIALVGSSSKCLGQPVTVSLTMTGTGPWTVKIPTASYNGVSDSTFTLVSSPTNVNITPVTAGAHTYSVSTVGNASCPAGGTSSGSATVYVSTGPPSPYTITAVTAPGFACSGTVSLLTATSSGGAGITYSWNNGSGSNAVLYSNNIGGPFVAGPFPTTTNQVYAQFGAICCGQSGYHACVQAVNGCGNTNNVCSQWIQAQVSGPAFINPPAAVTACPNDVKSYTCGSSSGATLYSWTLGGSSLPITSGQGSTSVQVTFPAAFTSGSLCVTAALTCGGTSTSPPRCMTISKTPATPFPIAGPSTICPGATNVSYSIPVVAGATGYNWTVPAGVTITGGQNTTSITVNFPTPYNGAPSICVTALNSPCGNSAARCLSVYSGIPSQPAAISGPLYNLCNSTGQYSVVNPVAGLTYTWTNPAGTTLTGQGTSTILLAVSSTFYTGTLSVVANSLVCPPASSLPRVSSGFWGRPNTPGIITANPNVFCSGGYVNFSVTPEAPLPTYTWTVSNGTIGAGNGSNNIDVTWGATTTGTVTVRASNTCGINTADRTQSFSSGCREEGTNTSSATAFSVYPNPAHDKITVSIDVNGQTGFNLQLRDMSGRVILSEDHQAEEGLNAYNMDLKGFAKGIYMLEVQSANDSWKAKVIIE